MADTASKTGGVAEARQVAAVSVAAEVSASTPSSEGLRERRRRENQERIADIALALFEERGYAATTVDDIADRAGISQRTFFRYFDTKEDVVFRDADLCASLEALELPSGDPQGILAVLEAHAESSLRAMAERSDARKFRQVRQLIAREPALKLASATRDQEFFERLHDRVSAAFGADNCILARLVLGVAYIQMSAALETFAKAEEVHDLEHTVHLYEQSRQKLRDLLGARTG